MRTDTHDGDTLVMPRQRRRVPETPRIPEMPEHPVYDYPRYSRLTGPLTEAEPGRPYRVGYRSLMSREAHRIRVFLMLIGALTLTAGHFVWLLWPSHWATFASVGPWMATAGVFVLVAIALLQLFNLVNVTSMVHAALAARDPIPVRPEPGTRVAFLTTIVPGKEPVDMVMTTLKAATRMRHDGRLDVWLLDEGNDPEIRALCAKHGIRHFSRKGVAQWNQPSGPHRAKTKHGNYNAWLAAHGDDYDFLVSVDPDHVPLPNLCERMLGYFRDPDVAFVLGPQVYGNYADSFLTRAAESQQFLFHSLVQRAGNRYRAPMLVGTNNAVRIAAIKAIGGFYDSISEDMATGLQFHNSLNPQTGRRWSSVYTPDVLAVGEGPSSWTDFFSQQMRWSRGGYGILGGQFFKAAPRLGLGRLFNYILLITFYPMAAIHWMLSALCAPLLLGVGASGLSVSPTLWLMIYGDAMALQFALFFWSRKHNVSPHEPEGSLGINGMLIGALAAPIYAVALFSAFLRRPARFVVTPKGESISPDRLATFRIHLVWAAVLGGALATSVLADDAPLTIQVWTGLGLLMTVLPALIWGATLGRLYRARPARARQPEFLAPQRAQRIGGEATA